MSAVLLIEGIAVVRAAGWISPTWLRNMASTVSGLSIVVPFSEPPFSNICSTRP